MGYVVKTRDFARYINRIHLVATQTELKYEFGVLHLVDLI